MKLELHNLKEKWFILLTTMVTKAADKWSKIPILVTPHILNIFSGCNRSQYKQCINFLYTVVHAGFFLGLIFNHADRVNMSHETSADLQWTTWCYTSEDRTLHNQHYDNMKSSFLYYLTPKELRLWLSFRFSN